MKAKVIGSLVAVAFIGLVGYRIAEASRARSQTVERVVEAPLVRTAVVGRADVEDTVQLTGSVVAAREVAVYAKLGGRIEQVTVQVGDRVKAGQLLALVEHKEIAWQAKQAQAAVQAAQAGHLVAQAGRDGAQLELDRTRQLAEGGAAPPAALEGAELKLRLAEAQVAAAAAQAAQAAAAAGLMQQQVENARITAPIEGVVTSRGVEVGTMVGQQLAAFVVQDARTLELETSVDLATFARLQKGQKVAITVEDLPGERFEGAVSVLSPTLDPQTRRASIEIAIDNAKGRLLPHAFAQAHVTLGQFPQALVVPRDAVLMTAQGAVAYRIRDGRAEAVNPKLGPATGSMVAVLDGLEQGDAVALGGLGQLFDGASVRAVQTPTASLEKR